jgi:hypothetical protein
MKVKVKLKRVVSFMLAVCFTVGAFIIPASAAQSDVRYTVLVLDISAAATFAMNGIPIYTADPATSYVKQAASIFVSDLMNASGINHIAVVTYDSSARIVSGFTSNFSAVQANIEGVRTGSGTGNLSGGVEQAKLLVDGISDEDAIKNVVVISTGLAGTGTYNYTGVFNYDTVGSDWINNASGINIFAYANSVISTAEEIKKKATVYSIGLFQNMNNIPNDGQPVLALFKLIMSHIASLPEHFYDVDDLSNLKFVFEEIADNPPEGASFKFAGMFDENNDTESTYFYDDAYFLADSRVYNPKLATMSLCFELTTYARYDTNIWSEKTKNARELLTGTNGIGFADFEQNHFWNSKPTKDSIGAVAARKLITDEDGNEYTLIALGIRGGGYESEWASNFTMGANGTHHGFTEARENVLSFLEEYISNKGITGDIKLWVVGFSRAAATANMVGGELNMGFWWADKFNATSRRAKRGW